MIVPSQDVPVLSIAQPPQFCEYAGGPCDQSFGGLTHSHGLFLYPSAPQVIANTIEAAVATLRQISPDDRWLTWKDLGVSGQIIFCQICKALRVTRAVYADVTTLNFNLLFEIGYALGLRLPVFPLRDTSFQKDKKQFDELGLLDTLGYLDFENSSSLASSVREHPAAGPFVVGHQVAINNEQPLYLAKSHIQTEGMVKLMSALKKSGLRFRTFDPRETSRLSLHEAFKQVHSSVAVVVHLVSPERMGAIVHNSRCAFLAGMAMAAGKFVLILQETEVQQPIDYRDVIRCYSNANQIQDILIPLIRATVETLQDSRFVATALPLRELEKLDLGDLAAENEIKALEWYFVPTGHYNEAKRGHARLVVGRKGAGKTAIFYGVRKTYWPSQAHLVLDLKPEGHQFTKLRDVILKELSPGLQQHVLTAFWNYLLLMELTHKILNEGSKTSYRDSRIRNAYLRLAEAYGGDIGTEQGDFSERLLKLVDDILSRRGGISTIVGTPEVTQIVYGHDIHRLNQALSDYLKESRRQAVWLLFDNLDKGWPVGGAKPEDVLLLKCLLEATRKLEQQFEARGVELHAIVFIRNDIYEHLLLDPADRGKNTAVILDWDDPDLFREIIRRRIMASSNLSGSFEELWPLFFETHVRGEESFAYILSRTLMRPREVLAFARGCIDVAINRGHEKVREEDILHAEKGYSEDEFVGLSLELQDVNPEYADVLYAFIGGDAVWSISHIQAVLAQIGVPPEKLQEVVELLLWFGFFGIQVGPEEERYSYQFQHNLKKMKAGLEGQVGYRIHPAFGKAVGIA